MFVVLKKDYFSQKAGTTLDIDEPHTKSLLDQGIVEAIKATPTARSWRKLSIGV